MQAIAHWLTVETITLTRNGREVKLLDSSVAPTVEVTLMLSSPAQCALVTAPGQRFRLLLEPEEAPTTE